MKVPRLVFLLVLLVVISGTGIGYFRATPHVIIVQPGPDLQSVPSGMPFKLTFSKAMKPDTVEEHLTIDPPVSGSFTWQSNTLTFTPDQPWLKGETITVTLTSGSQAAGLIPLALLGDQEWSFTIAKPLIVYLWPAGGEATLYALDPDSGEVLELLPNVSGILDFDINPEGTIIYYSTENRTGGSDIFVYDRITNAPQDEPIPLLSCQNAYCRSPKISPGGKMLAYERNPLPGTGESLYPQVWIHSLERTSQQFDTIAGDLTHPTRLPSWSSKARLAFYDVSANAYIFIDPHTQDSITFLNDTGESGSWSPDGNAFIAPEIFFTEAEASPDSGATIAIAPSHLQRFDLTTSATHDLSVSLDLEDTSPVYSPDGLNIAFARKSLDPALWTPGRQLWVMPADGTEARALSNAPYFNHSSFAWSPDGQRIAYLRFNQDDLTAPPELWLTELSVNSHTQLVIGGYAPQWMP
jgi:Tol biopolymer transport system component